MYMYVCSDKYVYHMLIMHVLGIHVHVHVGKGFQQPVSWASATSK